MKKDVGLPNGWKKKVTKEMLSSNASLLCQETNNSLKSDKYMTAIPRDTKNDPWEI